VEGEGWLLVGRGGGGVWYVLGFGAVDVGEVRGGGGWGVWWVVLWLWGWGWGCCGLDWVR